MKKILLSLLLMAFLLLRPDVMKSAHMLYPGDDYDYFAHASSLVFGQFPSYKNEYFNNIHGSPLGAIGCGILASPFVFVFSLVDKIEGSNIGVKRTQDNMPQSWAVFGFIFASVFYFSLACLLLYQAVKCYVKPHFASLAVILLIICQGIPLFAYRRPVFSHVTELFLQSLFVYLFLKNELKNGQWIKKWWAFSFIGVCASLVFLTRYNNFLFALMWPLVFIARGLNNHQGDLYKRIAWVGFPFVVMISFFKFWPQMYNHYLPYENFLSFVVHKATLTEILNRIVHVFIGLDWGLLYTAPFLFLGIFGVVLLNPQIKRPFLLICAPLLINFLTIIFFGSQGGWYGYRYLIASAFPLFVLPLALWMASLDKRIGLWAYVVVFVLALFPLVSMICFECNALTYMDLIPQDFGLLDYGNSHYQIGAWKSVLDVKNCWPDIMRGGPKYCHELYSTAALWLSLFRTNLIQYFPGFDAKILIRVCLVYLTPFFVAWSFRYLDS